MDCRPIMYPQNSLKNGKRAKMTKKCFTHYCISDIHTIRYAVNDKNYSFK